MEMRRIFSPIQEHLRIVSHVRRGGQRRSQVEQFALTARSELLSMRLPGIAYAQHVLEGNIKLRKDSRFVRSVRLDSTSLAQEAVAACTAHLGNTRVRLVQQHALDV